MHGGNETCPKSHGKSMAEAEPFWCSCIALFHYQDSSLLPKSPEISIGQECVTGHGVGQAQNAN